MSVDAALEAPVVCTCTSWAGQVHFLLLLIHARLQPYGLDPFLSLLLGGGLEVEVARGREEAKDMLVLSLGVLLASDGGEVVKVDGMPQLALLFVFVDGELFRAEHDMYRLPRFSPARSLEHRALLDDAVVFVAAELRDRRGRVDGEGSRGWGDRDAGHDRHLCQFHLHTRTSISSLTGTTWREEGNVTDFGSGSGSGVVVMGRGEVAEEGNVNGGGGGRSMGEEVGIDGGCDQRMRDSEVMWWYYISIQ